MRQADRSRTSRGAPAHDAMHRLQTQRGTRVTEPASRTLDVRVGSSTDALTPVSVAERSLAARGAQWAGLGSVVLAAIAADQLTKMIVSSQLDYGEALQVLGPFSIHHVQNSGIAFG